MIIQLERKSVIVVSNISFNSLNTESNYATASHSYHFVFIGKN